MSNHISTLEYMLQPPKPNWRELQRAAFLNKNPNIYKDGYDSYGNPLSKEGQGLLGYKAIDRSPFVISYSLKGGISEDNLPKTKFSRLAFDNNPNLTDESLLFNPDIDSKYYNPTSWDFGGDSNGKSEFSSVGADGLYQREQTKGYEPYYGSRSITITPELRSPNDYNEYLKSDAGKIAQENLAKFKAQQAKGGSFKRFVSSPIGMATLGSLAAGFGAAIGAAAAGGASAGSTAATTAGTTATTGSTAAASTGLRTGLTFAKNAAIKNALMSGGMRYVTSGGDIKAALKSAAIGGVTSGYGGSIANKIGINSDIGVRAFTGGLEGAASSLADGGNIKDIGKAAAFGAGSKVIMGEISDRMKPDKYVMIDGKKVGIPVPKPDKLSRATGGLISNGRGAGIPIKPALATVGAGALGYSYLKNTMPAVGEIPLQDANTKPSSGLLSSPISESPSSAVDDNVDKYSIGESRDDLRKDINVLSGNSYRGSRYSNF